MRWLDELKDRVSAPRLSDYEIELLLRGEPTGSDEHTEVEIFLRSLPRETGTPRDPGEMATSLAATARLASSTRHHPLRRVVAIAAVWAVVFALSGVAMAADHAVPGDVLYRIDRALENAGIGDGGIDERIVEFDTLIDRGMHQEAFDLLDEFAESAPESDAAKAQRHLELAATESNGIAEAAQDKDAASQGPSDHSNGNDNGMKGRDFGQDRADEARSERRANHSNSVAGPGNEGGNGTPGHSPSDASEDAPGQSKDVTPGGSEQSDSPPSDASNEDGGNGNANNGNGNDGNHGSDGNNGNQGVGKGPNSEGRS